MKPASYTLSDSESEPENVDNDDIIFNVAGFKSSTDSEPKFEDELISPAKKKKVGKAPRNAKVTVRKKAEKKPKAEVVKPPPKPKSEVVKQPKPAELLKLISVVIDSNLLNHSFGSDLLTALRTAEVRYRVQNQSLPSTITWTTDDNQSAQSLCPDHLLFLWMWKEFIELISEKKLTFELKEKMKLMPDAKVTLIVFGIEEYYRKSKTWKKAETNASSGGKDQNSGRANKVGQTAVLSRNEVELAVAELQLLNLPYKFFETGEDLGLYVVQYTKALSELPLKLEKNKKLECADWYATGDSKESVRVDAAGNGLMNLWQQQICQFPNVTLEIAQAIASNYGSPLALMNAYDSCSSQREAELMLQNIPIRRIHGPLTSVRKVGPELSKKVHQFFCEEDGNAFVS